MLPPYLTVGRGLSIANVLTLNAFWFCASFISENDSGSGRDTWDRGRSKFLLKSPGTSFVSCLRGPVARVGVLFGTGMGELIALTSCSLAWSSAFLLLDRCLGRAASWSPRLRRLGAALTTSNFSGPMLD